MEWPEKDARTGKPITTPTNQAILLAAVSAAESELPNEVAAFRERIEGCKNWRSEYTEIMEDFVLLQARASSEVVVEMCRVGLDQAESLLLFRDDSGKTLSLKEAFDQEHDTFETLSYKGPNTISGPTKFQLASPHGTDAEPVWLTGDDAIAQLKAWVDYGCMEPSAGVHASALCRNENVTELVQDKTFCLLGITSEMGPTYPLLKIPGAHVMGVARAGPKIDSLVEWFKKEGPNSTCLEFPAGGADLLTQAPKIAQWIIKTAPVDRALVLMPLAYLDGEANVRVVVAMDKIISFVMGARKDVSLAYLISPATAQLIPTEAVEDARKRYQESYLSMFSLFAIASLGSWLQPSTVLVDVHNIGGTSLPVLNGLVNLQGPNYALSKMMQQWRCLVAHSSGVQVAAPNAPATRTYSVMHSTEAAAGLEGFNYFPPMLAFDVLPASTLLAAIVISQLSQKGRRILNHPLELFWDGSVHGGAWRCPYKVDSCGVVAYLLGRTIAKKGTSPKSSLASPASVYHQ